MALLKKLLRIREFREVCGLPYVSVGSLSSVHLDVDELFSFSSAVSDVQLPQLATAAVHSCRSLYREFGSADTGALYKSGHTATCTAKLEGREVFVHVQIRRIFLMSLRERHIHLSVLARIFCQPAMMTS